MTHDLKIPERYGIFGTVGDTVGPGGWARALRNVPVFVHLARAIEKASPRAVVLNYTNPMAALTDVLHRTSSLRNVGLCHGVFDNINILKTIFKVDEENLKINFAGINHFFWILDFTVNGKPGYPMLKRKLKGKSFEKLLGGNHKDAAGFAHRHFTLFKTLYEEYGYLPYSGDRHTCEFLSWTMGPKSSDLKRYDLERTTIAQRKAGYAKSRRRTFRIAAGKEPLIKRSRETAIDIMSAIATNTAFTDVVNLPNNGQVDNLPRGAVVETMGTVDALGFRGISAGPLPEPLRALTEPHCRVQTMTVDAALEGNIDKALTALIMDPSCSHLPPSQIRKMGKELISATKAWLPQFK